MTRSFSEPLPRGGRLLLILAAALVLAGVATFHAAPAGACTPPENFPQCTTTTTEPPETTTTVPPSTTSTLPTTTTLDTAVPSSVPSTPPSVPGSGSPPAPDPGTPPSELAYTGFDARNLLAIIGFALIIGGAVVLAKVSERQRLQRDTGVTFRSGKYRT